MNLLKRVNLIFFVFYTASFMLIKYFSTLINCQYIKKSKINFTLEFVPSIIVRGKLKFGEYFKRTYPKVTPFITNNKKVANL